MVLIIKHQSITKRKKLIIKYILKKLVNFELE
jgi:hypothetical protein